MRRELGGDVHAADVHVEDRRAVPQWGMVLAQDLDTDAFRSLRGSDVKVYMVLLPFARPNGRAWPKQTTIAKITGLTVRQVQASLSALEGAGFLLREPFSGDARRVRYVLLSPGG